jgi:hypothetical protein
LYAEVKYRNLAMGSPSVAYAFLLTKYNTAIRRLMKTFRRERGEIDTPLILACLTGESTTDEFVYAFLVAVLARYVGVRKDARVERSRRSAHI